MSLGTQRLLLVVSQVAVDAVAVMTAFRAAFWIRFELELTVAPEVVGRPEVYGAFTVLFVPLWLLAFAMFRLYDTHDRLGGITESARTFNACTMATMLVIVGTFVQPAFIISRLWVVSAWVLTFGFVSASRFAMRRGVYALRGRGFLLSPALIIGTNEEAVSLSAYLRDWRSSGVHTVGYVSTEARGAPNDGHLPHLGGLDEVPALVSAHGIEDLIVAITAVSRDELLRLCEDVDPLPVQLRLSSGLYELLTTRVEVRTLGTVPLMSVQKNRLDPAETFVKTLFEISVTLSVLLLIWPVLLAIAVWIKLDSQGPVFHRRRVLGVSNRQFDAFKFRTMYVDGDERLRRSPEMVEELQANHKLKDDPRVTKVGRVLRRYSLDELPQLFNVLFGQMALVGPRMISPEEAPKYGRQRLNLLAVKPGITGLWQVSGRSELSYEERVRLDMFYVRNYSIWLDLQILFIQTLPAVLKGRGAY